MLGMTNRWRDDFSGSAPDRRTRVEARTSESGEIVRFIVIVVSTSRARLQARRTVFIASLCHHGRTERATAARRKQNLVDCETVDERLPTESSLPVIYRLGTVAPTSLVRPPVQPSCLGPGFPMNNEFESRVLPGRESYTGQPSTTPDIKKGDGG